MSTYYCPRRAKTLLIYLKHSQGIKGRLSLNVIREICSYIADFSGDIAQVTATFFRFFNCRTMTWGPKTTLGSRINADSYSSWLVLQDGRLFCCGGCRSHAGYEWDDAYLLSRDGVVDQLPHMLTARKSHGVIQLQHIYVFSGCKRYADSTVHIGNSNRQCSLYAIYKTV